MTNGIVLLNLGDRNAAEFSRLEVPGSYDKALGALTAGTYVNVYKWQYQGFALTASICTVEDMDTYLLLKDKTKGGEMRVYPDDTVEVDGPVQPPTPPTPSAYNGYKIRLGHVLGEDWYDPYITIVKANIDDGVVQSLGGSDMYFKFAMAFASGGDSYTASFYNEFNQGEFGMFFTYLGSGLVKVRLYSYVSGLSYCQVPQSGSPEISDLPDRSSSTLVHFYIPSDQDWIDILVWR